MKKFEKVGLALVMFIMPVFASAAFTVEDIIKKFGDWIGLLIPIAVAIALLVFIWGLITFIAKSGSEEARAEGRQRMIWGVIALFVIVSIWGLTGFVGRIIGVTPGESNTVRTPAIPQ